MVGRSRDRRRRLVEPCWSSSSVSTTRRSPPRFVNRTTCFRFCRRFHIFGTIGLAGAIAIVDLRLLERAAAAEPPAAVAQSLLPITWVGFVIMFLSGGLLFAAQSAKDLRERIPAREACAAHTRSRKRCTLPRHDVSEHSCLGRRGDSAACRASLCFTFPAALDGCDRHGTIHRVFLDDRATVHLAWGNTGVGQYLAGSTAAFAATEALHIIALSGVGGATSLQTLQYLGSC